MKPADPLTLPLDGLALIEASAGTGKTTALVRLYLRALLVEGLSVEQILAVTFTRAATGELSVRIRKELTEARVQLQADKPEKFWAELFALADNDRVLLAKRVDAALAAFDEKAVFTIHGFCQRMLADNAFETATAFSSTQSDDEEALREEVAADFWRRRMSDAGPAYARWLVDEVKSPTELLKKLDKALMVSGALYIEPEVNVTDVKKAELAFEAAANAAAKAWQGKSDVLRDWLLNSADLKRNVYVPGTTQRLLDEWEAWLDAVPTPSLPVNFDRLTREKLEESLRKAASLPGAEFFKRDLGGDLKQSAERLRNMWWQECFAAAFEFIRGELRRRKRHARETGYDDMLVNLREVLAAPGGKRLAARIAEAYPLIMVDEYQDTDPLQHEIFSRIHTVDGKHGLILIGDPKQAIYRFRGADIFTYMRVRHECEAADRIYSLAHNYRSTPDLLKALNALFEGSDDPFGYEAIPYAHVEPGLQIAPLVLDDDKGAALTVLWQPVPAGSDSGKINKDEAERLAADICAAEIARLLELGATGKAHYEKKPVQAKDIAVLVNTNAQGGKVQRALRERGIAAVTVSNESVFAVTEAEELQALLAAVEEPTNGSLLRRSLATSLLGKTAGDLVELAADEARWSEIVAAFRGYRELWQTHGFSAMFARLLAGQGVIERTLAREDGERVMTNLRHLAELAGEQASRRPGIAPLMVWFAREREETVRGDETRQLRLESDENLVRIVTVHKAKGLQYPIVFLPFLWGAKKPECKKENPAVLAHDDDYRAVLDLGSERAKDRQDRAAEESYAEEARKTYVALTRAERACYLIAMPANQLESSAIARLLNVPAPDAFETGLRNWTKAAGKAMQMRAPVSGVRLTEPAQERARGEVRAFVHSERLRQRFHIASYSLLAAGASGGAVEQPDWDEQVIATPVVETAVGIHAFPAGAASGIFLHAVIEALDFTADAETIAETVRTQSAAYGFKPHWAGALTPWLVDLFATPLGAPDCALADIPGARRKDELEFHFPLNRINAAALDEALSGFAPQAPRPVLNFAEVAGQMKGYMDLVFEHGGRYWIADYKSNRLGNDLAAYTPGALDRAMAEHRYDLQYLIYTVALHRYLKTRIADYDYERHFGGVLYLFLRGMAPAAPAPRGVWHTRPARRDVERLATLLAGGRHE